MCSILLSDKYQFQQINPKLKFNIEPCHIIFNISLQINVLLSLSNKIQSTNQYRHLFFISFPNIYLLHPNKFGAYAQKICSTNKKYRVFSPRRNTEYLRLQEEAQSICSSIYCKYVL